MKFLLATALALVTATAVNATPVKSETRACALVKHRVAKVWNVPLSEIRFCDFIEPKYAPAGWIVIGPHATPTKPTPPIGSTLMGWFAVRKSTGQVFIWNDAEDVPGKPL
ncbi:MAG TPA: hypothetical protein VGG36_01130 [Rhizomicrobium sp.]